MRRRTAAAGRRFGAVLGTDPWRAGPEHRARVGVMLQSGGLPNGHHAHAAARGTSPACMRTRPPVDELAHRLGVDGFARHDGAPALRLASTSASPWPRPWSAGPTSSSSTSRPPGSTPTAGSTSTTSSTRCAPRGTTVVVTTHSFEEAERLADHLVIVSDGRTVAEGARRGRRVRLARAGLLRPDPEGAPGERPPGPPPRPESSARPRFEAGTLLRNGEQLLVSLVLPLGALIGLALHQRPLARRGPADRRRDPGCPRALRHLGGVHLAGHLDRLRPAGVRAALLGTTPLGRGGLLAGKALATLAVEVIQWCCRRRRRSRARLASRARRPPVCGALPPPRHVGLRRARAAAGRHPAGRGRPGAWRTSSGSCCSSSAASSCPAPSSPTASPLSSALLPSAGARRRPPGGVRRRRVPRRAGVLVAWAVVATALAARFFRFDD